jgi:hypothetical protein
VLGISHSFIRLSRRKNGDKTSRADTAAMALERLQARAAVRIPDLDSIVV